MHRYGGNGGLFTGETSLLSILIIFLFTGLTFFSSGCMEKEMRDAVIKLNWQNDMEFAGIYVAKEEGFYEDNGINLQILELNNATDDPIAALFSGADFAVTDSSKIATSKYSGNVTILYDIFQKSPSVFLSMKSSGIKTPKDMEGKRIAIKNDIWYSIFFLMMNAAGANISRCTLVNVSEVYGDAYDMTPFYNGSVDVWSGYIGSETVEAQMNGYEINIIRPEEYVTQSIAGLIIAKKETVSKEPSFVRDFIKATLEGWEYALSNRNDTAHIVSLYNGMTVEYNLYAITDMTPYIYTGLQPLGYVSEKNINAFYNAQNVSCDSGINMSFLEDK